MNTGNHDSLQEIDKFYKLLKHKKLWRAWITDPSARPGDQWLKEEHPAIWVEWRIQNAIRE